MKNLKTKILFFISAVSLVGGTAFCLADINDDKVIRSDAVVLPNTYNSTNNVLYMFEYLESVVVPSNNEFVFIEYVSLNFNVNFSIKDNKYYISIDSRDGYKPTLYKAGYFGGDSNEYCFYNNFDYSNSSNVFVSNEFRCYDYVDYELSVNVYYSFTESVLHFRFYLEGYEDYLADFEYSNVLCNVVDSTSNLEIDDRFNLFRFDRVAGLFNGESAFSYNEGYNAGFIIGENSVLDNLDDYNLYTASQYSNNYIAGYNAGVAYASDNDLSFYTFLRTIFESPIRMFQGSFNFSLPLGNGENLNFEPLLMFLLSIGIVLSIADLINKFKR